MLTFEAILQSGLIPMRPLEFHWHHLRAIIITMRTLGWLAFTYV
jgi:hypothetical protein